MGERPDRTPPGGRTPSPITRRILAVNVLALAILVAGVLYLGQYRRSLIEAELAALQTEAAMFAGALGEGAVVVDVFAGQRLVADIAGRMVRRLVESTGARARLFVLNGRLVADSRLLAGPGGHGQVTIEELPLPGEAGEFVSGLLHLYDRLVDWILGVQALPLYRERARQNASDYGEAVKALSGAAASAVRRIGDGRMLLSIAVPVQRYKRVLGALMLSRDSRAIDEALLQVRIDILKVFAVALAVTVLLSVYLAGTIARPIRRLATAAERIGRSHGRQHVIPDLRGRDDEIGDLARALREMTEALWLRMDATERFAADVAHEIKNPLTSLQSAVETAARLKDPDQQRKLMSIIQEDVRRLDRLITDISDASRLDAELSRAETAPVDVGAMLRTLVDLHESAGDGSGRRLELQNADDQEFVVTGIEGRLAQVFRNLIANAESFGPPEGTVRISLSRNGRQVVVTVEDEGPGLPPGKEEAIFDRFYSERPEGEAFGTHSGLGLSISKQIVDAHGGSIASENRRTATGGIAGARFVVRLPVA